jgi:hypothetical protein
MNNSIAGLATVTGLGLSLLAFAQAPKTRPLPRPAQISAQPTPAPVATPRPAVAPATASGLGAQMVKHLPTPTPTPTPFAGLPCRVDRDCDTGACEDGICCDRKCDGNCYSCKLAGHVGICTAVPDGQDPRRACQTAIGGTPACGGACYSGQCAFPDVGTWCGICMACDGNGRCIAQPADDERCGVIDCSRLDTRCRVYQDLIGNRCAGLGVCKAANDPATCNLYTNLPCS